jgi:hypothetical protein
MSKAIPSLLWFLIWNSHFVRCQSCFWCGKISKEIYKFPAVRICPLNRSSSRFPLLQRNGPWRPGSLGSELHRKGIYHVWSFRLIVLHLQHASGCSLNNRPRNRSSLSRSARMRYPKSYRFNVSVRFMWSYESGNPPETTIKVCSAGWWNAP